MIESYDIGPGNVVAVCGERSIDAVLSMLAVFAAGATLMLVDSSIPVGRRRYMFGIVEPSLILHCQDDVDASEKVRSIFVGDVKRLDCIDYFNNHEDDRAYIAFTSGSTGKPKAILGSHRGLSHFLSWQRKCFSIKSTDRFANLTNLSFDVYFRDSLLPLISGATLCIPDSQSLSPGFVFDFLRSSASTVTHLVPSISEFWVSNQIVSESIPSLRYSFFAGEPLERSLVEKWRKTFISTDIINLYGPTETTLAKCYHRVDPNDEYDLVQPIGKGIDDTLIHIVAENGNICGIDEEGEIYIQTPYRSHGYISNGNSPTFVTRDINGLQVPELYPTGDIGKKNKNNIIEIFGRKDDQVKINGVRIDLSEIKSHVKTLQGVSEALCTVKRNATTKTVVLFVESANEDESFYLSPLKEILPSVAVPSSICVVKPFPRLPNGKIDRAELSRILDVRNSTVEVDASYVANGALEQLRRIWRELLGCSNISNSTNFFDAGGNSLSLMLLHEKIENAFSVKIPQAYLFQFVTIESQERYIIDVKNKKKTVLLRGGGSGEKNSSRRRVIGTRLKRNNVLD